jgi:hypothetical protein
MKHDESQGKKDLARCVFLNLIASVVGGALTIGASLKIASKRTPDVATSHKRHHKHRLRLQNLIPTITLGSFADAVPAVTAVRPRIHRRTAPAAFSRLANFQVVSRMTALKEVSSND